MRNLDVTELCQIVGGAPYCGPQGYSISNYIPDKVAGADFGPACAKHDIAFSRGSGISMTTANQTFLNDLLQASSGNPLATAAAYIYFGAVSAAGVFFYGGGSTGVGPNKIVYLR
jgi:hypothetical protein